MVKPRKMQKWKRPEFSANPVLFMVREGLGEVRHIEAALRAIEQRLLGPSDHVFEPDTELPRLNLEGWIASLAETYLAIAYLAYDPRTRGPGANGVSEYMKRQIDAAEFEWGGAAQLAGKMLSALSNAQAGGVGRLVSGALMKK